jgi:hypothetical protein
MLANESARTAVTLAERNHYAAFVATDWLAAAVEAIFFAIGRAHHTAGVHAVDFDFAGKRGCGCFGRHRLADFVREDKRRLVLAVQIAGELERANALRAVDDDARGREQIGEASFCGCERSCRT